LLFTVFESSYKAAEPQTVFCVFVYFSYCAKE